MGSKTISLEIAYRRLKAARLEHESFSQAARRLIPPAPGRAGDLLTRAKAADWGTRLDYSRIADWYPTDGQDRALLQDRPAAERQ